MNAPEDNQFLREDTEVAEQIAAEKAKAPLPTACPNCGEPRVDTEAASIHSATYAAYSCGTAIRPALGTENTVTCLKIALFRAHVVINRQHQLLLQAAGLLPKLIDYAKMPHEDLSNVQDGPLAGLAAQADNLIAAVTGLVPTKKP